MSAARTARASRGEASPEPRATRGRTPEAAGAANPLWSRLAQGAFVPLQARLRIGAVDDPLEREADRVAEAVVSGPAPPQTAQRKCAACEEEEIRRSPAGPRYFEPSFDRGSERGRGGAIQRAAAVSAAPAGPRPPGVSSAGAPLAPGVRAYMEPRFGADFGGVAVHTGSEAARSAAALNARAYTVGRNVVFGAAEYRPDTQPGRRLIAHELTHVLQQAAAAPDAEPRPQRAVADTAGASYDIDDTIRVLRQTLTVALHSLGDLAIPAARRAKIQTQFNRLQPLLPKLEAARASDGRGVAFGFDADPKKNEIIAGDSDKSLAELYAGFMAPPRPRQPAVAASAAPELQAWALPGGLRITPLTGGADVQRCELICVGVIILGGLLLAGCRSETTSANRTTPCTAAEQTEIERFHSAGAGWVDTAMTRLAAYREGSASDDVRRWVAAALDANFHTTEATTVATIERKLGAIQGLLAAGASGRYKCECSGNADAYTLGTEIHLCPRWFASTDRIRRITTVIHEIGHATGLEGSLPISSGRVEDIYEFHAGYATMTPAQAITNPDPFAVFARQVANDGREPPGSHR